MDNLNYIKQLIDKDFAYDRYSTLIIILVILIFAISNFLDIYTEDIFIHSVVIMPLMIIVFIHWFYNKYVFPKGEDSKQNIVIAITVEDAKQKSRITKDFAKGIERQLRFHNLTRYYNVIVLNNSLSEKAKRIIYNYNDSLGGVETLGVNEKLTQISKKLNAKFYVFGEILKRNEGNSTYCLNLEALLLHSKTDKISNDTLQKEFSDLWKKEISFLEEDELNGFKSNANYIFFTATYMLGLATLIDNRFEQGIIIWEQLEHYIKEKRKHEDFKTRIERLKCICYSLLSRLYHFQGRIKESVALRDKFYEVFPNEYHALLNESIKEVSIMNNPEYALDLINRAQKVANEDGTWRYNKLYLLIKIEKEEEALKLLEELIFNTFINEVDIINQVIEYNKNCLEIDNTHIQSYFILGVLCYKKTNNITLAYDYFDKFVNRATEEKRFKILKDWSKNVINEILEVLEIKT